MISKCAICRNALTSKDKTRLVDDILICKNCTKDISNDLHIKKSEIKNLAFLYLKNKYKENDSNIFMRHPENEQENLTEFKYKKAPNNFWKGDSTTGFTLGLFVGAIIGLVNMIFIHLPFMGSILFICIWLFVGTNRRAGTAVSKWLSNNSKSNSSSFSARSSKTNSPKSRTKHHLGDLYCPRCKSSNVQLIDNQANIKSTKTSTKLTANLNPLHPLTIANVKTKTKVKKKTSSAKTAAAFMTAGTSMVVTGGLKSNKSKQYHCLDCGNVFKKK
ncbi:hypothetical protein [Latilactobacillus curvatus]|uniref:hypothetical protein n=1 Tax=Latilactobacillus curvatus TaxID=28038 RepID=UPI000FECA9AC|nr:hypothetical protein [Latilactobacillus curvatus]QAR35232.1 hypothetical protein EQK21_03870 [Latilactobacillus curvatus]